MLVLSALFIFARQTVTYVTYVPLLRGLWGMTACTQQEYDILVSGHTIYFSGILNSMAVWVLEHRVCARNTVYTIYHPFCQCNTNAQTNAYTDTTLLRSECVRLRHCFH